MPIVIIVALFALDPTPSPAQSLEIVERIENLSHPRFVVRERASRVLLDFGSMAKPALRKAIAGNADVESLSRLQVIFNRIVDNEMLWLAPFPCIDAWWYDAKQRVYGDESRFPIQASYLRVAVPDDSKSWPRWRAATKAWARDKLVAGTCSLRMLRLTLAWMHARDEVFINNPKSEHVVNWREYLAAGK